MAQLGTIGTICLAVFLYLGLVPMVNDDTCSSLASNGADLIVRIFVQFIALCWVPWN